MQKNKTLSDELFELGIRLRDEGKFKEAVNEFLRIVDQFPNDPKIDVVYTVLGGVYMDLDDYDNSSLYLIKATKSNPKYELASLCLYLSFVKLGRSDLAIEELKRFLDLYPANLYKDTLEELLGDLKEGYAISFKDTIVQLAERNGLAP